MLNPRASRASCLSCRRAPKDFSNAREISDELGFTTVPARTVSKPLGATFEGRRARVRRQSVSLQRRALLLPPEVKELGQEEAIVFCEGLRPIRCRKIRSFNDRRFRKRLMAPPAVPLPPRGRSLITHSARELSITGADGAQQGGAAPVPPKKEEVVIRQGTAQDGDRSIREP